MHEAAATPAWVPLAYLVAGSLFILALRGLASPESARRGNRLGMAGMAIAVVTTLVMHDMASLIEIVVAIVIGAAIGLLTARRIAMTAMPQLVAAFHSLVGLAAVLVAAAAFLNPEAFGIATRITPIATPSFYSIFPASRIELGLGMAIGAITFSGSVIAFLKLNGNMSGKPILLPGRHVINLAILAAILGLIAYFVIDQSGWVFWTVTALSFLIGFLLIVPIGGADMPVVVSMLNSYSGWAAAAMGFTLGNFGDDHHRRAGRIIGRDPELHHVPGDEPQLHQRHRGRLRRRCGNCRAGRRGGSALQARFRGGRGVPDEAGRAGHHRSRLRHGRRAGPTCAARDG
jgi:NAD(P) transhydrogenase subunit beta